MIKSASLKPIQYATLTNHIPARYQDESWKEALQNYITYYNQTEIDQYALRLESLIVDFIHQGRLEEKQARLKERELYRGAIVTNSETNAEAERIFLDDNHISIILKLHIRKKVIQDSKSYIEEKMEHERLWLTKMNDGWRITRLEPLIIERRPAYGITTTEWYEDYTEAKRPIRPFLNIDLMPNFSTQNRKIRYQRELATAYADLWWNKANPRYENFENNCTNYISQCLHAGELSMHTTNRRDQGWWYKGRQGGREWWSYSWAVAHSFYLYLSQKRPHGIQAQQVSSPDQLELGDVIFYDWNGKGRYSHSTIVTGFDMQGNPLINANTANSRHRYWDYQDSYAWTPNTQYRFFHISDYV